ncbi:Hsp20/alpha crystallin family protein [Candidatus Nomurabacteria bacterium]|nr:Hsp20/alpha crystallin family protein [Candidatus Nomurabacteria bacterium]
MFKKKNKKQTEEEVELENVEEEELTEDETEEEADPWNDQELEAMEEEIDEEGQLTVDVYQDKNNVIIKSTVAGVEPEDIDISIDNDMITIRGSREKDRTVKEDDYFYQECYWGSFSRSIILPVEVEADKVDAAMKNGILTITLPKAKKKEKEIKVKDEN